MILSTLALTLVVHLTNLAGASPALVRDATIETAAMLDEIGVAVEWDVAATASSRAADGAVRLTLLPYETGALRRNIRPVLGAATTTALGTGVALVFYRRVIEESDRHAVPAARMLACAMAHELRHLLQEVPAHEPSGLMRDVWREAEFRSASVGRLRFSTQRH